MYNLLAIKAGEHPHPDRPKHLNVVSEKVMARRAQIEQRMEFESFLWSPFAKPQSYECLQDLYTLAISNSLAGYVYRSIEEMICQRKSAPLQIPQKSQLVSSMFAECGAEITNTGYKVLRADDPIDARVLFCLALRWNNRHLPFLLAEELLQREWWATLLSENTVLAERCTEDVYRTAGVLGPHSGLTSERKQVVRDNVEQDVMHGYIVKLAESLDPIR